MVKLAALTTGSIAVAEEIVQDAFEQLHKNWATEGPTPLRMHCGWPRDRWWGGAVTRDYPENVTDGAGL